MGGFCSFLRACLLPRVWFNPPFTGEGALGWFLLALSPGTLAVCVWPTTGMWQPRCFPFFLFQVQDIEFTQIEMKVIEGLKIGNECLNKMHQVCVTSQPGEPRLWAAVSLQPPLTAGSWLFSPGYVDRRSRKNHRGDAGCCGVPAGMSCGWGQLWAEAAAAAGAPPTLT